MHFDRYDAPMPAKNPRLTITLQPSLAAQLRRLSELTGNSQSALISELLEGSTAIFEKLIHVLEAATAARDSMKGRITDDMEEAHSRLEKQLGLALETFDDFSRPILDAAEEVKRRSRRRDAPAARAAAKALAGPRKRGVPATSPPVSTPISNRGVRSDPNAIKRGAPGATGIGVRAGKVAPNSRGGD